jgi:hypothetical protein
VPDHPRWFGSLDGLVAIHWRGGQGDPPCTLLERGSGTVIVRWGPLVIVGCYVSPNIRLAAYEAYWDGVAHCIRGYLPCPLLVLGDFNARHRAWNDRLDNAQGETVLDWAATLDLRLLNRGSVPTCVRWQGESIVDLSWATPSALAMVSGWRVAEEVVSLSDHRHVRMNVTFRHTGAQFNPRRNSPPRRWSLMRLDRDLLEAATIFTTWTNERISPDPNSEAAWFRDTMTSICDVAMPRVRRPEQRAAYWWSVEISQLREVSLRSRRQYQRCRRRRRADADQTARAYIAYRDAHKALRLAIKEAKSRSWNELLEGLDRDPWGRPYKLVMGKLRPWVPPLTEILDAGFVGRVVDTLFPVVQDSPTHHESSGLVVTWTDDMVVTSEELDRAVRRLGAKNTAPGPDGIPGRAWVMALAAGLGDRLRQLFTSCLRVGVFPSGWKVAKMVLLMKNGRPVDSPSAYRPICLLDEAGKLFERIIADRLSGHLGHVGPDLSGSQFGFRRARSTVDAIMRVRSLSTQALSRREGVVLAVSLDIVNAFNSLPWWTIREALRHHRVPPCLMRVIGAYLRARYITYPGRDGICHRRGVECGVPQGSVLGPLLWNLAYDAVLRASLPNGVHLVCYADDTLVLAEGTDYERTIQLAELGVSCIVGKIEELGLRISPSKTEAIWFHKLPRGREPPNSSIRVGDVDVQVGQYMKYLGLILDSRWDFGEHFRRLVPRLEKVAGALQRLLPNLGGPVEGVRRLYGGVVRSVALYGAPVWSHRLAIRRHRTMICGVQRKVATRIARGYRTISLDAATLLARFPPLDILAEMDARVYASLRQDGDEEAEPPEAVRRRERHWAVSKWRERLSEPCNSRRRAISAILPNLEVWLANKQAHVTYRVTQVLTGQGCFGTYLCHIGREPTMQCHHCDGDRDSAQHTLEECPAWVSEREILVARIGRDLSPPAIVAAMLADEQSWRAVVSFCEAVMLQKEIAERNRERADPTRRRRRRRGANVRPAPS